MNKYLTYIKAIISIVVIYWLSCFIKKTVISHIFDKIFYCGLDQTIFTDYDKQILSKINMIVSIVFISISFYKTYFLKWENVYINNNDISKSTIELDNLLTEIKK